MILIKEIKAADTHTIRKKILRNTSDLPVVFEGDTDENSFHLGAFKNNKIIGIATFMQVENSDFKGTQFQLRGMAALQEFQGNGVGSLLIEEAIQILKEKKANVVWCNARISAVSFYKKHNFEIIGDTFEVAQIGPHYKMYKNI